MVDNVEVVRCFVVNGERFVFVNVFVNTVEGRALSQFDRSTIRLWFILGHTVIIGQIIVVDDYFVIGRVQATARWIYFLEDVF